MQINHEKCYDSIQEFKSKKIKNMFRLTRVDKAQVVIKDAQNNTLGVIDCCYSCSLKYAKDILLPKGDVDNR